MHVANAPSPPTPRGGIVPPVSEGGPKPVSKMRYRCHTTPGCYGGTFECVYTPTACHNCGGRDFQFDGWAE